MSQEFFLRPSEKTGLDSTVPASLSPHRQVRRNLGIPAEFDSVSVAYILTCRSPSGLTAAFKMKIPDMNPLPEPDSADLRKLSKAFETTERFMTPSPETDSSDFCDALGKIVREAFENISGESHMDLNVLFLPPIAKDGYAECRTFGLDRTKACQTFWMDEKNYADQLSEISAYMGVPEERRTQADLSSKATPGEFLLNL
jgi:hypothetical protein